MTISAVLLVASCSNGTDAAKPATTSTTTSAAGDPSTTTPPTPTSIPSTTSTQRSAVGSLDGRTVVIDPGHNGRNYAYAAEINRKVDAGGFEKPCNTTGTAAGPYSEAQFTWEVSQRLRAALRSLGATVISTRESNDGWGPCIDERGLIASRNHADLLLSIHADGSAPDNEGFHVIHPALVPNYTEAIVDTSRVLASKVRDALVDQGFAPSNYLGEDGLDPRGDLGTLNRAGVPAVMVESGNMRNESDLAVLRSADGQERLVSAFVAAVTTFLGGG